MKPKITKEQAKAIEVLRTDNNDSRILEMYVEDSVGHNCASIRDLNLIELANALINGYVVEKLPEEMVREFYDYNHEKHEQSEALSPEDHYTAGTEWGIRHTLYLLDIKIEGIST
ncbi:hypothetical protein HKK70_08965 [Bacillus safensis]|uniref:hypothetical protein n=1 Tax=Bacillus safensis TaxID=561879 RepID=UPI00146E1B72|nr:hypothetical protein [Bacillus safensis]MCM3365977.1 hypothetical protein [Bacillus safensis]NMW01895.1 hypothetical protein [Bacillus safensis]